MAPEEHDKCVGCPGKEKTEPPARFFSSEARKKPNARRRRRNFQNSAVYTEIIQSPCKKRDFPPSFLSPPFSPPLFFSSPLPLLLFIFFTFEKIPLLSFSAFLALRDFFRRSQRLGILGCCCDENALYLSTKISAALSRTVSQWRNFIRFC